MIGITKTDSGHIAVNECVDVCEWKTGLKEKMCVHFRHTEFLKSLMPIDDVKKLVFRVSIEGWEDKKICIW